MPKLFKRALVSGRTVLVPLLLLTLQASPTRVVDEVAAQATYPASGDEFVGPFPSWADVRATYGAAGDGVADDTNALQRAFDDVGTPGHASVVYLPAGVYRVTRTLNLNAKLNISILGEHPSRTTVRWDGPAGGDMVMVVGVSHSRYGRITWDGAGKAGTIYNLAWKSGHYFPTLNEHADEVFQDAAYGIRAGTGGGGDAETSVLRCQFLRLSQAGLSLGNFNVLDWWVWDSRFEDNEVGISNRPGAGNFYVYNSVFKRSRSTDLLIGNTGYFSFRHNYSINSNKFFLAGPIGSAAAAITFQGNTIVDPGSRPIETHNPGPQLLLDNVIRWTGEPPVQVTEPYVRNPTTADVVGLGNVFTTANPYDVAGRLVSVDDQVVDPSSVDVTEPVLPDVPTNFNRPTFEVPPGSDGQAIQAAIDTAIAQAGGSRPVVHLPVGEYGVGSPITIPAGADVQLVGDGGNTVLTWKGSGDGPAIRLSGPSRATLRDLLVQGNKKIDGVLVDTADQPGANLYLQSPSVDESGVGLQVDNLSQADVRVHDLEGINNKLHLRVNAARAAVFSGAGGSNDQMFDVVGGGSLVVDDVWHEGSVPGSIHLTDWGSFTMDGGNVAGKPAKDVPSVSASGFHGRLTLANVITSQGIQFAVQPAGAGTQALFLGVEGRVTNPFYLASPDAQSALIGSKLGDAKGGSAPVPDQVSNVDSLPDFLRMMLADLRQTQPRGLEPTSPDVSDVRLFRVFASKFGTAIRVQG
jgi:Pectate lyase superfamily protein